MLARTTLRLLLALLPAILAWPFEAMPLGEDPLGGHTITVCVNEVLPFPCGGPGSVGDDFIELYNPSAETVDLGGWVLEVACGGVGRYTLPAGTFIGPRGFRVFYQQDTGLALPKDNGCVHLTAPDGTRNSVSYVACSCDLSHGRLPDGGNWAYNLAPSPGRANVRPTASPTPSSTPTWTVTPSPTATPTRTLTPSRTPSPTRTVTPSRTPSCTRTVTPSRTPSLTRTPTLVPPSPTATRTASWTPAATASPLPAATATPSVTSTEIGPPWPTETPTAMATATLTPTPTSYACVCLSELLPMPRAVDWDGDGVANHRDEWIELYNPSEQEVSLAGWVLDDYPDAGTAPFTFPTGSVLGPGAYGVYYLRDTGVVLNNDGDQVRLIAPDGSVRDQVDFPAIEADASYGRRAGCTGEWVFCRAPSPGQENRPPPPTPTPLPTWWLYLPLLQRASSSSA
jgi:hypothetical protein